MKTSWQLCATRDSQESNDGSIVSAGSLSEWRRMSADVAVVAVLWVLLFELNRWLFLPLEETPFVNWVFLPAAIRVVSVLLVEWRGALGLFIGSLFTNYPQIGVNMTESLVLSSLSALSPYVGVRLANRLLRVRHDLAGLTGNQIVIISAICAGISAGAHNLYFFWTSADYDWRHDLVPMFGGDLTGTLIVLFVFSLALRVLRRRTQRGE